MEALEKDFQDPVDSEEVLQEDEADDNSLTDLSDEVSTDDDLINEKSEAQEVVDKVLSEDDDTVEQQEIIEFLLSELDEEDLDLISELDEEEDWDITLDSIFEKKKSKAERKKAAKKKAKWLKTGAGKKSLKKAAKRQKKIASGAIKVDKSRSKAMKKASKLYNSIDVDFGLDLSEDDQEDADIMLDELDEEDLDTIIALEDDDNWEATLDSIFEKKKSKADRKKAAKKKAKWLKTGAGKKSLKKQAKRQKKIASGSIKVDKSRSKAMKKASKLYNSYDPSVDVTALVGDSELSEEFKTKASTIFEAAVNREIEFRTEHLNETFEEVLVECTEEVIDNLTEKVDSYLDYVVEEWMQENEIAIESGIRSELTEDFIVGLKTLFTEHYVDIPDDKVDVLGELSNEVKELEEKLNTQINENIELKKEASLTKRDELIRDITTDLVETEVEKLKELSEGIEYDGDDQEFISKLETLRESYFPKGKIESPVTDEPVILNEEKVLNGSMSAYTNALSRTNQSSRV